MAHDVEEFDEVQFLIDGIEEEIILAYMQFAESLLSAFQGMIPPSSTKHKERPVIVYGEELNGFCGCLQYPPSPSSVIFSHCFLKTLRWDDRGGHRRRMASSSAFEEA